MKLRCSALLAALIACSSPDTAIQSGAPPDVSGAPAGGSDAGTKSPVPPGNEGGEPAPLHVLFIGNSYTYVNDVPGLLAKIAQSSPKGTKIVTEAITEGAATLEYHLQNPVVKARIAEATWTHVVLQGQSMEFAPAEPAKELGDLVLAAKAVPTWFVTWARAAQSDEYTSDWYSGPTEMQDFATYSYAQAASHTPGSLLSCVGEAFRQSLALHPEIKLHIDDNSHASMAGSYLAASTFYVALTGKPVPADAFVPEGVAPADAALLRNAALVGSACSDVRPRGSVHPDVPNIDYGVAGTSIPALLTLTNRGALPGLVYGMSPSSPFAWTGGAFPGGANDPSAPDLTFCRQNGYFWEVPASSACLVSLSFDATTSSTSILELHLVNDYRSEALMALSGTVGFRDRARLTLCEDSGYLARFCSNNLTASFWQNEDITLVVTNRGGAPTTAITGAAPDAPFAWANGSFPGGTGAGKPTKKFTGWAEYRDPAKTFPYCGAVLRPGEQCIVTLVAPKASPDDPMAAHTTLSLAYADALGPASEPLTRAVTKYR
jgi:hypothetical protein